MSLSLFFFLFTASMRKIALIIILKVAVAIVTWNSWCEWLNQVLKYFHAIVSLSVSQEW